MAQWQRVSMTRAINSYIISSNSHKLWSLHIHVLICEWLVYEVYPKTIWHLPNPKIKKIKKTIVRFSKKLHWTCGPTMGLCLGSPAQMKLPSSTMIRLGLWFLKQLKLEAGCVDHECPHCLLKWVACRCSAARISNVPFIWHFADFRLTYNFSPLSLIWVQLEMSTNTKKRWT